ncbi:hypothetical protein BC833DRAFT_590451 [Globomyces pollinis-pini]|nr:hypothetical protein BC833DRAFT_590451 [Globomyces pollinis-pini]
MLAGYAEPTPVQKRIPAVKTKVKSVEKDEIEDKEEESLIADDSGGISNYTPIRQLVFLGKLFFGRKFFVHRVSGLIYLLQYALALSLYLYDYDLFYNSPLIWTLPINGVFQTITAIYTFTFLPRNTKENGYFSDRFTMSFQFVVENSFFALILFFHWIYFHRIGYDWLQKTGLIEWTFVFFPYVVRTLWPKTRFRDSFENIKSQTPRNQVFYKFAITLTKTFYIWAKHYMGYFLNYARFLNRIDDVEVKNIYLMAIFSSFATTISIFLHTLKFRKMIGPRTSFVIYAASYLSTFYSFYQVMDIFTKSLDLVLICFVGLVINYSDAHYQHLYQGLVFGLLMDARYKVLPDLFREYIPIPLGNNHN